LNPFRTYSGVMLRAVRASSIRSLTFGLVRFSLAIFLATFGLSVSYATRAACVPFCLLLMYSETNRSCLGSVLLISMLAI
jgi:hypothetical protein